MGADDFNYLSAPELYSFEFTIDTIKIYQGEHQNIDPSSRYVIIEDGPNALKKELNEMKLMPQGKGLSTEGKKKKGKAHKDKKNSPKGKSVAKDIPAEEPKKIKLKQIFLPPFSISLRFFFNRAVNVEQVDLPNMFSEEEESKDTVQSILSESDLFFNLALDAAKKKAKGHKGKKDKKLKSHKIKEKVKPQVMPQVPPIQWAKDDEYSPEELSWRLPSEETFKRGICITFPATAEQMILWLQRGPFYMEVSRWRGYGKKIPIGIANLCFDSAPFIQTVLRRSRKLFLGTSSIRAEDTADILDLYSQKIGEISISFSMLCNGGSIISENLISVKGLFDFLREVESEKAHGVCQSCGKYGYNYDYELMHDLSLAIVPNAVTFDNSPFMSADKYKEYSKTLYGILTSYNPVARFGQHLKKVAGNGTSSQNIIV